MKINSPYPAHGAAIFVLDPSPGNGTLCRELMHVGVHNQRVSVPREWLLWNANTFDLHDKIMHSVKTRPLWSFVRTPVASHYVRRVPGASYTDIRPGPWWADPRRAHPRAPQSWRESSRHKARFWGLPGSESWHTALMRAWFLPGAR